MKKFPKQVFGRKINLRSFRPSDAPEIYKYVKDPAISRWTARIPYPYPRREADKFIRRSQQKRRLGTGLNFGIILPGSDAIIGGISFQKIDWPNKNAELGYWLGKPYWGRGLMSEAVQLMLKIGFEDLGMHRIRAGVLGKNPASVRVLKK